MSGLVAKPTPLAGLTPAKFNPRHISANRLEALKRSLEADALMLEARPVIALPDGTVVCGNQRVRAALELGWVEIPCVTVDLDPETARLWMLRDNNEYGEWAEDALASLLAELEQAGADLELTGADDVELDRLLASARAPTPDVDVAPPLAAGEPVSRPGEVYELGAHRLLCGDATDPEQVDSLLAGAEPFLLVTDPPYGVELDMEWRDRAGFNDKGRFQGTARPGEKNPAQPSYLRRREGHSNRSISGDTRADWSPAFALVPSLKVAYVWHADRFSHLVAVGLEQIGFQLCQMIVWDKERFVLSRSHYHWQHELCWYARKPGAPRFRGRRGQPTVWRHPSPKMLATAKDQAGDERADHPTQKPVAVYTRPLENHLRRGECFYEPFAGSGTALIAAEMMGRRCLAMELDPRYCDVIRQRYEEFAGGQARAAA